MKRITKLWVEIAKYDLDTAKAMMETGRYLYVAFMCHQSLEKLLKAIISNKQDDMAPYTHNLIVLANLSGVKFDKKQEIFLAKLNPFNIEARYPKTKQSLSSICSKKTASDILSKTEEIFVWLKQRLS